MSLLRFFSRYSSGGVWNSSSELDAASSPSSPPPHSSSRSPSPPSPSSLSLPSSLPLPSSPPPPSSLPLPSSPPLPSSTTSPSSPLLPSSVPLPSPLLPPSLPSITSHSIEPVPANRPDSEISNDIDENLNSMMGSDFNISQLSLTMQSAHKRGNKLWLRKIRAVIAKVERMLPSERTAEERYLLNHWRKPSLQSRSVLSLLSLNNHPSSQAEQPDSSSVQFPEIFVDASPHGIGLVFKDYWLAWTFSPNHPNIPLGPDNNIIISWAELIAVELAVFALAGYRYNRLLVRSDNTGVVEALTKKVWTQDHGLDMIQARILRMCEAVMLEITMKYIPTKANPADGPSRGLYPPSDKILSHIPSVPHHLEGLVIQVGVA